MAGRVTVLECDDVGLVVAGSARSVGLVLGDAVRHGEDLAWLTLAVGGMVGVDPRVKWEVVEVDHAEG